MSTSGVGTVNSVTLAKPAKLSRSKVVHDQITALRAENLRLMEDLYESHNTYHAVFRTALEGQATNAEMVKALATQLMSITRYNTPGTGTLERASQGYASETSESPGIIPPDEVDAVNNNFLRPANPVSSPVQLHRQTSRTGSMPHHYLERTRTPPVRGAIQDQRLEDWLIEHNISAAVRSVIHGEDFSFEDFVYGMEQDDLRRIGLRVGTEVKLWRAIRAYRSQHPLQLSPSSDDHPTPSHSSSSLSTVLQAANGSFDEPSQLRHPHQLQHHHKPISNSNSWDSSHSAGTATSSEYESCNGGEGS